MLKMNDRDVVIAIAAFGGAAVVIIFLVIRGLISLLR